MYHPWNHPASGAKFLKAAEKGHSDCHSQRLAVLSAPLPCKRHFGAHLLSPSYSSWDLLGRQQWPRKWAGLSICSRSPLMENVARKGAQLDRRGESVPCNPSHAHPEALQGYPRKILDLVSQPQWCWQSELSGCSHKEGMTMITPRKLAGNVQYSKDIQGGSKNTFYSGKTQVLFCF